MKLSTMASGLSVLVVVLLNILGLAVYLAFGHWPLMACCIAAMLAPPFADKAVPALAKLAARFL